VGRFHHSHSCITSLILYKAALAFVKVIKLNVSTRFIRRFGLHMHKDHLANTKLFCYTIAKQAILLMKILLKFAPVTNQY